MALLSGRRVAACTIAAKRHLSLAQVLAASFREYHPGVPFFLLLADEANDVIRGEKHAFSIIELTDEVAPELQRLCFQYTQQELTYALTPYLIEYLLRAGFEAVAFIKQESLVTGDLFPVLEWLRDHAIVLTPHLLAPLASADAVDRELKILLSGSYNGGFVAFSDSPDARAFLEWWSDRLASHCLHAVGDGTHFEQRWLDFAPAYVGKVFVCRDPGVNVGHWNLPERRVEVDGATITVDGHPCRLFRFSGFDPEAPGSVTRYYDRLNLHNVGPAAAVYRRYHDLLIGAGYAVSSRWPYAWEHFDNGVPVPLVARRIYRGAEPAAFPDPFQSGSGSYFEWLNDSSDGVSNLWLGVYRRRADLQAAFPDVTGKDRRRFLRWIERFGRSELQIPKAFPACQ